MKKRSMSTDKKLEDAISTYIVIFLMAVFMVSIASQLGENVSIAGRIFDFLGTNTLGINPETQSVESGGSVTLEVVVKQVSDVYGVQFDLTYDSSVLEFLSIQQGSFLGSTSETYWIAPDTATAGLLDNAALIKLENVSGNSGDGVIATINSTAKAGGTSIISLSNIIVLDSWGNQISVNKASGSVEVRTVCTDSDNDGYYAEGGSCGAMDCNDNDKSIHPGATETCNNKDDNCDGNIDEAGVCPTTKCWSAQHQYLKRGRYRVHVKKFCKCAQGTYGYTDYGNLRRRRTAYIYTDSGDNENWETRSTASEYPIYQVECLDGNVYYTNQDHYTGLTPPPTCTDNDNDGYSVEGGECGAVDCNDNDKSIHPGATETCNNKDDNCDGNIDEAGVCTTTKCWSATNNYLKRGGRQFKKFCKCAQGSYNYQSFNYIRSRQTGHEYIDVYDNENWQTQARTRYYPAKSVKCSDGNWYNTNQDHYS